MPHLVALNEALEGSPVTIISIDSGRRGAQMERFLEEQGVVHTLLNDPTSEVFDAYRVVGVPTTVLIDPEGRLMFRHVGFSEGQEEEFAKEIETLLAWSREA